MTPKQKVEIFIVVMFAVGYCILVGIGKANVEGFVVLSTYIIKKFLDLLEEDKKGGA